MGMERQCLNVTSLCGIGWIYNGYKVIFADQRKVRVD